LKKESEESHSGESPRLEAISAKESNETKLNPGVAYCTMKIVFITLQFDYYKFKTVTITAGMFSSTLT